MVKRNKNRCFNFFFFFKFWIENVDEFSSDLFTLFAFFTSILKTTCERKWNQPIKLNDFIMFFLLWNYYSGFFVFVFSYNMK